MDRSISVVVGVFPPSVSANDCGLVTLRGPDEGSLDLYASSIGNRFHGTAPNVLRRVGGLSVVRKPLHLRVRMRKCECLSIGNASRPR
jgi:hypothetical protein